MKRRKISSIVRENGGMRARTDSLDDSLSQARVVNDQRVLRKTFFLYIPGGPLTAKLFADLFGTRFRPRQFRLLLLSAT